ncbi:MULTISPECIES: 2-hydroxyacid dehydrogenase [unclassified Mesorhizobium]|uniref:2-hydroxyacid dehydrogenase n=1 Tax=unclassified Mesorhizobium TaxID=325217 RepID=UPI000FCAA0C1|nr:MULTISPECIES: 2-hydroxyacid dehydrogenase [unclassified Mesorhizobium]TGP24068.1 2-hydroxyacid dehydrogenase [Mesorhizobium sp. M1D.F.Ca.ET.231.01.1.1]TGP35345.1 2-hydroxyacid dehydrogenase [Mesorhizobium sp. M1D.F.Ca.ET.234.01.1.1]TGS49367.1 2-hydroxyacid dehydrogenase [Mesorhizobium sp. M1D.F.Ca.ET.184.01.1.1]TGS63564.1 2-hydroxyacid dehydrogenase [Mesorhizobium sp. M1D.F.Ca.ET.183.01.1.1]
MTRAEANSPVSILVPGQFNDHAIGRIDKAFRRVWIERADPSLVTGEMRQAVRGIASFGGISAAMIDALPNLEIIANFGVGYDSVDARHAATRGVMVTNTPDVLTEEVADTTIGLLINTVRELYNAEKWLRDGDWVNRGNYPLSRLTLRGRRIGIFGMGRIGLAVAHRLEAFGLPIAYHNRRKVEGLSYEYHATLKGLAEAVDTLICIAPGGAATEKAINAEILSALGPNGVFVNIGRGSTVDEAALVAALDKGTIAAAGLDVFADEPNVPKALLGAPNASLLPHVGSASDHTRRAMADLCVDNLVSWFRERRPLTPVPETAQVRPRS